jgi:hypothetical protein
VNPCKTVSRSVVPSVQWLHGSDTLVLMISYRSRVVSVVTPCYSLRNIHVVPCLLMKRTVCCLGVRVSTKHLGSFTYRTSYSSYLIGLGSNDSLLHSTATQTSSCVPFVLMKRTVCRFLLRPCQ